MHGVNKGDRVHISTTAREFDPLGKKTRWFRLCLFVIYSAGLSYGLLSPEGPPQLFENSDKALHFLAFAGFAFSTRLAFVRPAAWKVWSLIVLWAPVSEVLQNVLQVTRHFSWFDIVANLTGVVIGALCWWIFSRIYRAKFTS